MNMALRLALFALVAALAVNYFEPLPALLHRLWAHAAEIPQLQRVFSHHPPAAPESARRGSFRRRLVAVGDLHGDFPNAQKVLKMARVINDDGLWSGETDIFVQTGDIVDRGTDTLLLYDMIEKLREQARDAGQQVVSTHGNHEWMNAIGDWRYVSQAEIQTFGGVSQRQEMLAKGWVGRAWRNNYTVAARVPLHPASGTVNADFVPSTPLGDASILSHAALAVCHGGFAPSYPDLAPFPSKINKIGDTLLGRLQDRVRQPKPHPPNPYPGLPMGTTKAEERLYGADGPLWYRGWASDPDEKVCAKVDRVLDLIGTRRMIMGHTPNFEKIVSRCGAKILVIDTGISHAYGGVLSALEIVYAMHPSTNETAHGKDAWLEHEVVSAIYPAGKVLLADDMRVVYGDFSAWANVPE